MNWLKFGKGVCQGCILSPCLFNLFVEYIIQNAGLDDSQGGIKIARRNINNLRYADDSTLTVESKEELTSLLMKVKVQLSSVSQSCPTLCHLMDCSTPGFPVHHQLPELAQTHVHWVGDAIQLSHPLLSPSPAFSLSQQQVLFQWVSSSHPVAKVWSLSFSINPSNEYSGLISFRIDWFDLIAIQGTLKSLLQHHSSKASILRCSAFFIV